MNEALKQFTISRYEEQPYDFPWNPQGFGTINGNDISAHMPLLEFLSRDCQSVTEFGTRYCHSTSAFVTGLYRSKKKNKKLICYDIEKMGCVDILAELLKEHEAAPKFEFNLRSTVDPNLIIEETDFLFIDTLHTYAQVEDELLQAGRVRKYIGFHDTFTDWEESREWGGPGIGKAITEFLDDNPEWKMIYRAEFNHGLIVLEKN